MNASTLHATNPFSVMALKQMDRMRQARGKMLDRMGFGPQETPYSVLHTEPGLRLRKYAQATEDGRAVLLVPAPIKRAYIWDLLPRVSVVRRWMERGYKVYLAARSRARCRAGRLRQPHARLLPAGDPRG